MVAMAARHAGSESAALTPTRSDALRLVWSVPPWGRREVYEEKSHDDAEKRRRVGNEGDGVAEGGDRHARERRPDHAPQVELRRVERDGREELRGRHQIREDGLLKRSDQGAHGPLQGHEQGQDARAVASRGDQQGEGERDRPGEEVSGNEGGTAGDAVGERAPEGREQTDGQETSGGDHDRPGGASRMGDDERPDSDGLHPRADHRDHAPGPQQEVVPVVEGPEGGEPTRRRAGRRERLAGHAHGVRAILVLGTAVGGLRPGDHKVMLDTGVDPPSRDGLRGRPSR